MTHRERPLSPELHLRIYLWFLPDQEINKYGMQNDDTPPHNDQPIRIKLKGRPKSPDDAPTKAQRWVRKLYSTMPKNPLNPEQLAMVFGEGDDQQLALFEIRPSMSDPNAAYINWFQAYPQRQGVGTKAMRRMQELATEDGIKLILNAWTKGKVPEKVLKRFYGNMGFQSGKSREGMIWEPINEDQSKQDIETVFKNVANSFMEKQPYDALEWMEDSGLDVNDSPALKALFDANLHQFAKLIADDMRYGDSDGFVFERIRESMESIGIDMNDHRIGDAVSNYAHIIDRGLLRMIEHGAYAEAMTVMAELAHWGLHITLEDIIDPEEEREEIIKTMLHAMAKGHLSTVRQMVDGLLDIGLDWQEIGAISKSLAAGNKQLKEASWSKYDPTVYDDDEPTYEKNPKYVRHVSPNYKRKDSTNITVDVLDDGIREPTVVKVIPGLGMFIFTGHFRDRLRQRNIDPHDAIDLVANTFRKHMALIASKQTPFKFVCLSPSKLAVVMMKEDDLNGSDKTVYKLITVYNNYGKSKEEDGIVLREDDVLDKPTPSIEELAAKYKVSAQDVLRELKKGVEVETEHTTKLDVAREIALDHLSEDLYYYVKLAKAEKNYG